MHALYRFFLLCAIFAYSAHLASAAAAAAGAYGCKGCKPPCICPGQKGESVREQFLFIS